MIYPFIRMCDVFWVWRLADLCSNEDGTLHIFLDFQAFAVIFRSDRNLKSSACVSMSAADKE